MDLIILILLIIAGIYFLFYLIAMSEIIGSWMLTDSHGAYWWDIKLNLFEPAIIPFLAFFEAINIYEIAMECYENYDTKTQCRESLFAYLRHGRMKINEYKDYLKLQALINEQKNKIAEK